MAQIKRRDLLRWVAAGLPGLLLLGCRERPQPTATPVASLPTTPTAPGPTATEAATQSPLATATRAVKTILRNLNRPRYNVRFIRPTEALDHDQWRLQIEGIASGPATLTYQEMLDLLPAVQQNSRMACVEGWSFRADWEGFTMQGLLDLVEPEQDARYVRFESVDGYYEVLSIEELLEERILFAHNMDGQALSDEHGWPLRVILPPRYGYKGSKSITKMRFTQEGGKGYWPTVGPYTVAGFIETRRDYPQDLPGESFQTIEGVEQTY